MTLKQKWQNLIAAEKEKTKDMTFQKKVEYVAGNWWAEILITLVAIGMVIGIGSMIYNACKDRILYFSIVDVSLSEEECQAITDDFNAYIGNTSPMKMVVLDAQVSSLGTTDYDTVHVPEIVDHQQKSMTLIGTGLLDAYICPKAYVDYLRSYDDLDKAANIMGEELAEKYAERITLDGYAVDISGTEAAEAMGVGYDECYLVFTYNNHFPEVTQAFARYLLEMTP